MSEFSLINQYFSRHQLSDGLSVGDDCALINLGERELVICVDTLVAGRHFPLHTSAHAIGHKSVAVNLSDLAAMGAVPHSILLALSLPSMDESWLNQFSTGLYEICDRYGVKLIGGDTTRSDTLSISVTALGFVKQGTAIRRSGAKCGDLVCVSGQLGSASFALPFALNGQSCALQSSLDYPTPQLELGRDLVGFASSMIDVSDGLAQDLGHILTKSQVGAVLELDQIPAHPLLDELPNEQKWRHQLNGGDDYQLCFTISTDKLQQFEQTFPQYPIYVIGQIRQDLGLVCRFHGQIIDTDTAGWQHF